MCNPCNCSSNQLCKCEVRSSYDVYTNHYELSHDEAIQQIADDFSVLPEDIEKLLK